MQRQRRPRRPWQVNAPHHLHAWLACATPVAAGLPCGTGCAGCGAAPASWHHSCSHLLELRPRILHFSSTEAQTQKPKSNPAQTQEPFRGPQTPEERSKGVCGFARSAGLVLAARQAQAQALREHWVQTEKADKLRPRGSGGCTGVLEGRWGGLLVNPPGIYPGGEISAPMAASDHSMWVF